MSTLETIVLSVLVWIVSFIRGPEGQAIEDFLTSELDALSNQPAPEPAAQPAPTESAFVPRGVNAKRSSVPTE